MRTGLILSLLLAILAVVFALQNPQSMDVNLLFFETQGSTALILILAFGFGVIVGVLSTLPKQLRTRRKLKELQKKQGAESKSSSSFTEPKSSSGPAGPEGTSGTDE
jgi:uncharacterized integral membrane protein